MPAADNKPSVHPVPLLFFLAVITLIADYKVYDYAGAAMFLAATALLAATVGWVIGRRWRMYPWQIGLLGAVPAVAYILWRFYAAETVEDSFNNLSLFVYHPLLVVIAGHFGGLVGRWQALKSRPPVGRRD